MRDIPHDPALPRLRALLPDDRAPAFVAAAVGEADPTAGTVTYVRWWPRKHCTVLWAFPGRLVSGVLFAGGLGERLVARATYGELARGETYRYLPERRLLLEQFPLDWKLPGLRFAASARRVGELLGVELEEALPVSYKPWRRCVLRYRGRQSYFGKVFRHDRGKAMLDRLVAVVRAAPWLVPAPVAYAAAARLLLFEEVRDATEMTQLIRPGADLRGPMEDAARGLAGFRRLPAGGLPVRTAETILADLEQHRRTLAPVVPELAAVAAARLRRLADDARELPPERLGLAHGAFRHNQLLVRGDELVVLDLDGLCVAGAGLDPGTFLAGLDRARVHSTSRQEAYAACAEHFAGVLDGDPRWVSWHRDAARVSRALHEAFALAPRWRERAAALLQPAHPPSLVA